MTASREIPVPEEGRTRVRIEDLQPLVEGGRCAVKRVVGDRLEVTVDLIGDGHDHVAGVVRYQPPGGAWVERPLRLRINDRYGAEVLLDRLGPWTVEVSAWIDTFSTWREGLIRKAEAGQDVGLELREGALLVKAAAKSAWGDDKAALAEVATRLETSGLPQPERIEEAQSDLLAERMGRWPDRSLESRSPDTSTIVVDPQWARFSSWYELFPRSCGELGRHGTFEDAANRLEYVADLGFDVVYLPPIHPIGVTHRKGRNNALVCEPQDPGSPWAIGATEGGHTAVHPDLGTLDDFRRFVQRAEQLGLRVALDIAFQCSPDHPWVSEYPTWFKQRPDGSIQYAENPPKKYQDVYPFDFGTEDWKSLWGALRDVFLFWADQGVRIFRVDNPHTKPLPFWEWCIRSVKAVHPEAVFLAEAFTRPKLMYALAKLGFSQSYTYFTWRNTKWELTGYVEELAHGPVAEFFRPNFWPNTPDILPEELQWGGRPAYVARLILAATLSSNYGIYGPAFELMEHVARPGSGEYIDNEKFELRQWDLHRGDSLRGLIKRINRIRRDHKALQHTRNVRFHGVDNDRLICFSKRDDHEALVVVVNLDYHHRQSGWVDLDLQALGLDPHESFQVHDLLGDGRYLWSGARNYVELDPGSSPAQIFRIRHRLRSERDFDYFV